MGADLDIFHTKFPHVKSLVLQDQAETIERVEGNGEGKFKVMVHDFFTPQPIKGTYDLPNHTTPPNTQPGARAYYLHSIFHDHADAACLNILANLKPAMKRGYSKLLINENVIPDKGAHYISTGLDMLIMAVFSGAERTERQ